MGAETFETHSPHTDVATAFRAAVEEAQWEHGHGGGSGTIAEKDEYVVITRQALTLDEASRLARKLIDDDDPRVDDKWGPAGAIGVKDTTRTVRVTHVARRWEISPAVLDQIVGDARRSGQIGDTDTVTQARRVSGSDVDLTVAKAPAALAAQTTPDGWLFFGWASS